MEELKDKRINSEHEIKNDIAHQSKTEYLGLSISDRRLLKSYFGYLDVPGTKKATKLKENAHQSVQEILWPKEFENNDLEKRPITIQELGDSKNWHIPSIFEHDHSSLSRLFIDGQKRTDGQELSIIRIWQVGWLHNYRKIFTIA